MFKQFSVAFVLALCALSAASVAAKWRRIPGAVCVPVEARDVVNHYLGGTGNDKDVEMGVTCPIEDSDAFSKREVTGINVHGYDGSTLDRIAVQACRGDFASENHWCGERAESSVSGVGNYELHPSLSMWNTTAGLGYLGVSVPGFDKSYSTVRGIFLTDGR